MCHTIEQVVLFTLVDAFVFTVAIAYVCESIKLCRIVVDAERCVCTAACIYAHLYRTIITGLAVFLQYDIDDARRTLCREFC